MRKILLLLFILIFSNVLAEEKKDIDIKGAYYRSYQYEKVGDYENAIKSLMVLYKKYPDGYTINLRLGWLYYLNKNYSNSIYHYEKAMKIVPSSIEAKLGLTLPLLAQGKYGDVEKICYQIISTDYFNYYGNLRLSIVLRLGKKLDTAVEVVNKMLSLYPTDVNFLTELGIIRYLQGEYGQAKYIFNDILILDPENVTAREYLQKIK
ncbi:tetratricopeptide repeat protein [Persephonella sp.]